MENVLFHVPEVFTCSWDGDVKAVIGRWTSFRTPQVSAVLTRHIAEGGARGALTCVVDLSGTTASPRPEDALWIETHLPTLLAQARIGAMITIDPGGPQGTVPLGDGVRAYTCSCLTEALTISRDVLAVAAA